MNKIIKGGLSILAAGLLAAGCVDQRDTLVYFDPAKTTAPVLSDAATTILSVDGNDIVLSFNEADYGIKCAVRYSLYASASSDFENGDVIAATIGKGTATIAQKSLNSFILNLGAAPEQEFTLYFRLQSDMSNDQNTAVAGTQLLSNVAKGVFTPYDMLVSDKDTYGFIYVIGDYCKWGHADPSLQYLYNYKKDGTTYSGLIDFGGKAANGFKLTGGADWDHGNWGIDNSAAAPGSEASTVSLINDGGSGNISCYSDRFYMFSFDKSSLTLTKEFSFNQMGLIGFGGDWNNDIVMEYNPGYNRFYVDVQAASATEFKFRIDAGWDTNWGDSGEGLVQGGGNIPLEAGDYRIYFDLNKMEYSVSASMFGQPEPGLPEVAPEPVKPTIWSLAGNFNSWSPTDESTNMANLSGDIWVLRNYEFAAGDEFKIVAGHDWANENYGGPETNSTSTIDSSNPYGVFKPELGIAFDLGGTNIQIPEAGAYDITLDYAAKTLVMEKHVSGYSLIGMINGDTWSTDVMMTQDGDVWTSPVVTIAGGFKIRYDFSWDDANTYGAPSGDFVVEIGTPFTAVQPGSDIKLPADGDYKVIFNAATKEVTVNAVAFPETMYMIGDEFGSWDWSSNEVVDLVPVYNQDDKAPGQFWTVRYFSAGKNFKFCPAKAWNGKEFNGLGTNEGFSQGGGNCIVDQDGFYLVHIDLKNDILHMEPARIYGIGSCFGGWDAGMSNALFTQDGKTLQVTLVADGELRMYVESARATTDWWTREFIILDGKIAYRGTGPDQERVNAGAGQVVTLDFNDGTGTIK
ncbi:MAG: SusF/SusE family outer membrane protein [Candidatus Cryptobacteroides sp.]